MWVFEEKLPSGEKLTDVINKTNVRARLAMHFILIVYAIFFQSILSNLLVVIGRKMSSISLESSLVKT